MAKGKCNLEYKDVKQGPAKHYWNCDACPLYRLMKEYLEAKVKNARLHKPS